MSRVQGVQKVGKVVVEGQGKFKELSHPLVYITRPGSWQDFKQKSYMENRQRPVGQICCSSWLSRFFSLFLPVSQNRELNTRFL